MGKVNAKVKKRESLSDIFTYYHFWMQNKVEIYERNYKRIHDVIANIGGITKDYDLRFYY